MEHILLLVIIAGGIHASSAAPLTECDVTRSRPPCTPEEGETVHIKLMANATGYTLVFYKEIPIGDLEIFLLNKGKVEIQKEYQNRAAFHIISGTFKLRNMKITDTGQYSLKAYLPIGTVEIVNFTLTVTEKETFPVNILVYVGIGVAIVLFAGVLICVQCRNSSYSGYQTL